MVVDLSLLTPKWPAPLRRALRLTQHQSCSKSTNSIFTLFRFRWYEGRRRVVRICGRKPPNIGGILNMTRRPRLLNAVHRVLLCPIRINLCDMFITLQNQLVARTPSARLRETYHIIGLFVYCLGNAINSLHHCGF